MTLVIISRSLDGIMMIADRKVTREDEQRFVYGEKLHEIIGGLIFGYAGSRSEFDLFRTQLTVTIGDHPELIEGKNRDEKLVLLIAETMKKVHTKDLELVVSIANPNGKASAWHFLSAGGVEEVTHIEMIGGGRPYAYLILKSSWFGFRIMQDVADIAYFLIRYIQDFNITNEVGVGNGYPQIWFIPDKSNAPYEANSKMLGDMETQYEAMSLEFRKALGGVFPLFVPTDGELKKLFDESIQKAKMRTPLFRESDSVPTEGERH